MGDLIMIAAVAQVHDDQVAAHHPRLVLETNRQVGSGDFVPVQLACVPQ